MGNLTEEQIERYQGGTLGPAQDYQEAEAQVARCASCQECLFQPMEDSAAATTLARLLDSSPDLSLHPTPDVLVEFVRNPASVAPLAVTHIRAFCNVERTGRMPPEPTFNAGWSRTYDPIVNVTFKDAQEFCAWVAARTGHKLRLPTEEEWEKAARGTNGKKYPWGNEERYKRPAVEFD